MVLTTPPRAHGGAVVAVAEAGRLAQAQGPKPRQVYPVGVAGGDCGAVQRAGQGGRRRAAAAGPPDPGGCVVSDGDPAAVRAQSGEGNTRARGVDWSPGDTGRRSRSSVVGRHRDHAPASVCGAGSGNGASSSMAAGEESQLSQMLNGVGWAPGYPWSVGGRRQESLVTGLVIVCVLSLFGVTLWRPPGGNGWRSSDVEGGSGQGSAEPTATVACP